MNEKGKFLACCVCGASADSKGKPVTLHRVGSGKEKDYVCKECNSTKVMQSRRMS